MSEWKKILRDKKIKVTPQRLSVLEVIENSSGHMTAQEIYQAVRGKLPVVSLATIYSVIEFFCAKGLLAEIGIDPKRSTYELKKQSHHHFMCQVCAKVFDISASHVSLFEGREVDGHVVNDFFGYFYGECKECASKNGSEVRRSA